MLSFLSRFRSAIHGVLTGFDRIRFRGTQRGLSFTTSFDFFLRSIKVLLKDFHSYAPQVTDQIRHDIEEHAKALGHTIHYINDSTASKEKIATQIAAQEGRTEGLMAVLSAVEPCPTYYVRKSDELGRLELRSRTGKCLHYYHYWNDAVLGPCHVRLQSWFPFNVFVCVNGREMLALRLKREGIRFRQRDNCFSWVSDLERAQQLLDEQKSMRWGPELTRLLSVTHPRWRSWPGQDRDYYWSAEQTEWATDVLFRSRQELAALMPRFIEHSITTLGSGSVMRFLGHHVKLNGEVNGHFQGEVGTDVTRRVEGTRVLFRVNRNSVKFYDKQGSVFRVETTINQTRDFKSYRASQSDPEGAKNWRGMMKGVGDLPRRAEVSQSANERCLESLASVATPKTVAEATSQVCRRKTHEGRSVRALNVLGEDAGLLLVVGKGEHCLNGFRNRDIRGTLGWSSSGVTYRLRLLRAHGVIKKVSGTHRYQVTALGRELLAGVAKTHKIQVNGENREILQ
jgi:hypothetical protein